MGKIPERIRLLFLPFFVLTLLLISCSTPPVNWVTSIDDRPQESVQEYIVEISNGKENIDPLGFFCSSSTFKGYEGDSVIWEMADGFGISGYDMKAHLSEIPSLTITPEMALTVSETISLGKIDVYDSTAVLADSFLSWEEISDLSPGQYFVVFAIHNEVSNEVGEERYSAQCFFVLYVE